MLPLKRKKKITFKTCSEMMLSVCLKLTNSRRFRVKTANSFNNSPLLQNIKHPKSQYRAVYTERVRRVYQKTLFIHYRLNRVFVDRFKSESVAWTAGESTRQMGKHAGGGDASCGTSCERDTHQRREQREWAERRLLEVLETRWKRKDKRGIRRF